MVCSRRIQRSTFFSKGEAHAASLLTDGTDLAAESFRILGILAL